VRQARVVITTVGPYQRHGTALATACAEAGTDYVDLCGEPLWMAQMIRQLQAPAAASGARIVFSCGFDSVPVRPGRGVPADRGAAALRPAAAAGARPRAAHEGRVSGGTQPACWPRWKHDGDPAQPACWPTRSP
jgi:hypothetical protein